jgi:type II secretion system protein N
MLLFLFVFALVFCLTLPREAILGVLSPALARSGIRLDAGDARLVFPLGIVLDNASIGMKGRPDAIPFDKLSAKLDLLDLFRGLPFRLRAERGKGAFLELSVSALSSSPGKGRIELAGISTSDFPGLLPGTGFRMAIDRCSIAWKTISGRPTGEGVALVSSIRLPIPAPDSPVREADIHDARIDFTLQNGSVHVSSLRGKYEGSPIEGSGEIARIADPLRATITFHLKIPNPYEGKVAAILNLVAKNAKNANLRISGPLLMPAGEFQFF